MCHTEENTDIKRLRNLRLSIYVYAGGILASVLYQQWKVGPGSVKPIFVEIPFFY